MKILKPVSLLILIIGASCSGNAQTPQNAVSETVQMGNIEVYYFHYTKRCITCNAVENETKQVLEANYSNKMNDGAISFVSLNLDEKEAKKIAESLEVSGQTLLIVKGGHRINLTNDGFMHARTNPMKFRDILKSEIDKLL